MLWGLISYGTEEENEEEEEEEEGEKEEEGGGRKGRGKEGGGGGGGEEEEEEEDQEEGNDGGGDENDGKSKNTNKITLLTSSPFISSSSTTPTLSPVLNTQEKGGGSGGGAEGSIDISRKKIPILIESLDDVQTFVHSTKVNFNESYPIDPCPSSSSSLSSFGREGGGGSSGWKGGGVDHRPREYSKEYSHFPIPRYCTGLPMLPLPSSHITCLLALGVLVKSPNFIYQGKIIPLGYRFLKKYKPHLTRDSISEKWFVCEVLESQNSPLFRVVCLDTGACEESENPSTCWRRRRRRRW